MKEISILKLKLVREGSIDYSDVVVNSSDKATDIFTNMLQDEVQEVFAMITLNTKNNITGYFEVHRGNLNSSLVSIAEIAKRALLNNAQKVIVAHNHPSGNVTPSREDIIVTKAIYHGLRTLQIELIDSLIIGNGIHKSLRSEIESEK